MGDMKRVSLKLALGAVIFAAFLAGCGLDRNPVDDSAGVSDPVVAATVNGRPIYNEDVRAHAVLRGLMQEGDELDPNSDAFYLALEELIQFRLFAMEAEARGLDRDPDVRRRLEAARERVLAAAIYEEIDKKATSPEEIERLYRENTSQLSQGQEIRLRHMQFDSREAAEAAKRRLDAGEQFTALAFELSTARDTAPDGGDLGFQSVSDLKPAIRQLIANMSVGQVGGPIQVEDTWQLIRVEDRREKGVPSLETLRPRIIEWLRFQEISRLQEKLARDARIERRHAPGPPGAQADHGEEPASAPRSPATAAAAGSAPAAGPPSSAPVAAEPHGARPTPPPFPFPMGPGGVSGAPSHAPAPADAAPAQQQ
jgi:peptidyl-prolyl cis-trans isomerase C